MELGREPHVSELEDAVEKEVAILQRKNATQKQRRATVGNNSENENNQSISDSMWEIVQNFMKKWEEKLEKWDNIIEKIEFEEVLVDPPSDVPVKSKKKTVKEPLLLKGPEGK
jgi:hypothetical protein